MNSKLKGGRGEREFAALCRAEGYDDVRRGQQFAGGYDSPDVRGLPGVHVEVKRVERLNIGEAMRQSIKDCGDMAIPIVAHRRNREDWYVTMRAGDWFTLYREWEAGQTKEDIKA
jgi:Holliday junction resolvase